MSSASLERVLNVSGAADTAGIGWLIKQAFDAHSDIDYRTAVGRVNYISYPRDLDLRDAAPHWAAADVVHVNNSFRACQTRPPKPTVIHHHGTLFRRNPAPLLREQRARKAQGIASTLDLWLLAPDELHWVGAPYEERWLQSFRDPRDDGVLRIGHAPTSRDIKSTAAFLSAVKRLQQDVRAEAVLIERKAWTECLRRKGTVDVYFDQVGLGYGSNAIEAWGMGVPVIAGAADATLQEMDERFGSLPFVDATEGTIYDALSLLADPAERARWAARGLAHFREFHAAHVVVGALQAIYAAALH